MDDEGFLLHEVIPEGANILFFCWVCDKPSNSEIGFTVGYCTQECFEEDLERLQGEEK
jgi:hypothetical protein